MYVRPLFLYSLVLMFLSRPICFKEEIFEWLSEWLLLYISPFFLPTVLYMKWNAFSSGLTPSFYFILFFLKHSPTLPKSPEDVYHYFLPLTKIFLKTQLFFFSKASSFYRLGQIWVRTSHMKMVCNYSSQYITKELLCDDTSIMMWLFKQCVVRCLRVTTILQHLGCCYCHSLNRF